ncbi:MAG TPA: AAA family ATPase [Leptospiraceae bacterium]|nr:AAA family ATPase [Leptospiraceae bacterium]HMY65010.1 AAA family ATPase [Leptospiraceae bacterium]HMZ58731.1 AAA family ATPase [Leptospiraceae bacterium]HNF12333.1 AAA family ATPase [Leptospiraceae bacterium]HNF22881.1 AAA family ATPase [Leptospiraceae bacterium]
MKKLPLGIQTFSKLAEGSHYYVDKTEYIRKLADIGTYFFLSRPRRFGKSSFLDTLKEAYEGNENLFKGLYLEKNWDWSKKYTVIKISFGGGQTKNLDEFKIHLQDIFLAFETQFKITLRSQSLQGKFKELIVSLFEKTNQKAVILVDEYDKPILDVIENEETAASIRDELKNLYSVIKDSDAYIKFVFITGVSKFSRVSLFSGLNNLSDITLDSRFSAVCGYTQSELQNTFQDRLQGVPLNELKEWYNGYNFCGEKVYNPYDILHYLDKKDFQNYWFATGTPSFLIRLIERFRYPIPNLENIRLSAEQLESFDVRSIELETILFQTGYLTVKNIEKKGINTVYHLEYPNIEVKHSLNDVILKFLLKLMTEKETNKVKLYELLFSGNIAELRDLFHAFFASIPYQWYTNNTISSYEGYYASVFYSYFAAAGIEVRVEDSTNLGRMDMTAVLNGRCFIMEFKVNEMTSSGNALAQLRKKKYHEKYVGYSGAQISSGTVNEIYLIGIEFSKMDRNITSFDWETVQL